MTPNKTHVRLTYECNQCSVTSNISNWIFWVSVFNEYCSEKVLRRSNWQQSILRILTLFEKHVKCTLLAFVGSHLSLAVGGGKSAPYNQLGKG